MAASFCCSVGPLFGGTGVIIKLGRSLLTEAKLADAPLPVIEIFFVADEEPVGRTPAQDKLAALSAPVAATGTIVKPFSPQLDSSAASSTACHVLTLGGLWSASTRSMPSARAALWLDVGEALVVLASIGSFAAGFVRSLLVTPVRMMTQ